MRKDKIGRKIITEFAAFRAKVSMYKKVDKNIEEKWYKIAQKSV